MSLHLLQNVLRALSRTLRRLRHAASGSIAAVTPAGRGTLFITGTP